MWVSIGKLVHPHRTLYVMQQHPIITFGLEPYMVTQSAGVVAFSLAVSLLWTPIIRRAAALVLAVLMSAAIIEFGKIDAIGHIIPTALLIAIGPLSFRKSCWLRGRPWRRSLHRSSWRILLSGILSSGMSGLMAFPVLEAIKKDRDSQPDPLA